jgi:hypothetical protein
MTARMSAAVVPLKCDFCPQRFAKHSPHVGARRHVQHAHPKEYAAWYARRFPHRVQLAKVERARATLTPVPVAPAGKTSALVQAQAALEGAREAVRVEAKELARRHKLLAQVARLLARL